MNRDKHGPQPPRRKLSVLSNMMSDFVKVISPTSSTTYRSFSSDEPESEFVKHYVSFPGLDSQMSESSASSDMDGCFLDSTQRTSSKS